MKKICSAVVNKKIYPWNENVVDFLNHFPRGAYTSLRTINQAYVFDFNKHIDRLVHSMNHILECNKVPKTDDMAKQKYFLESKTFPLLVKDNITIAMNSLIKNNPLELSLSNEYKITVLISSYTAEIPHESQKKKNDLDIYCHIGVLPYPKKNPASVQVMGISRKNPSIKDSKWVSDRKIYENILDKDSNIEEVILLTDDYKLLEGTQTNIFIVSKDNSIITPEDGILKGTIRDLVLEACKNLNIPIYLEAFPVSQLHEIKGAFLTSTSRLILPIENIFVNDPRLDKKQDYHFSTIHPLIYQIQLEMNQIISSHCIKMFPIFQLK